MLLYHVPNLTMSQPQLLVAFNQADISSGEENMCMGQDWGYCLGNYAGGGGGYQNNRTWKRLHATDGDIVLGFKAEPKGHLVNHLVHM